MSHPAVVAHSWLPRANCDMSCVGRSDVAESRLRVRLRVAVRVMLARLEKKGLLKHQQDGLKYLYSATISQAAGPKHRDLAELEASLDAA